MAQPPVLHYLVLSLSLLLAFRDGRRPSPCCVVAFRPLLTTAFAFGNTSRRRSTSLLRQSTTAGTSYGSSSSTQTTVDTDPVTEWIKGYLDHEASGEARRAVVGPKHVLIYDTTLRGTIESATSYW